MKLNGKTKGYNQPLISNIPISLLGLYYNVIKIHQYKIIIKIIDYLFISKSKNII